jgi:hypothetical protein
VPAHRYLFLGLIALSLAGFAAGSEVISNWPAPATWSPPRSHGVTTLSEAPPLPFIAVTPCRVADTRGNGFTGAYGPPSIGADTSRPFTITGVCGIPAGAQAVSFNFAALNVSGGGDLRVYPAGGAVPTVSTMNYNANTPNIANAAVVPLGTGGAISLQADATTVDIIIDVNGYFSGTLADPTHQFKLTNSASVATIDAQNTSTTCVGACAIVGSTGSTSGAVAVDGYAYATGAASNNFGVRGISNSSSTNATGVRGVAAGTTGTTYGVWGSTTSTASDAAGVRGVDGTGLPPGNTGFASAGVRGESSTHTAVLGVSQSLGVVGQLVTSAGTASSAGLLGTTFGTALDATTGPWGVFAVGTLGATGAKHFVEPHPSDASRVILYSSLEGREVGTYFRGTARTVNREAVIEVPEDFQIVTAEDGLTVQITPIGSFASAYVESRDLNRIVVRASRDVEFDYLVQGVRRAFKNFQPLARGQEFMPLTADARMPASLTEEAKRRLIANGTYNADGTVNMETAERIGWTRLWKEREEQAGTVATEAARVAKDRGK